MTTRAVVIGAGIAGLATAAALRRHVDEVVVLEQDAGRDGRTGVAQVKQLHNLLGRAQVSLEHICPGFTDALLAHGGHRASVADETHVVEYGVRMPRRPLGLALLTAPRPQIEAALHSCLPQGIAIQRGARVTGLLGTRTQITGVTCDGAELSGDVIVDASGPASQLELWLEQLGAPVPERSELPVRSWYATMQVRRPPRFVGDPACWLFFPTPPATASCLISPIDAEHWLVSASGGASDGVPGDLNGYLDHARKLHDDEIAEMLAAATPVAPPHLFRRPTVRWRRYDQLDEAPESLMVVGDAVAALNPLLGQGISVAGWQAAMLADAMPNSATEHHQRCATTIRDALSLAELDELEAYDSGGHLLTGGEYFAAVARAVSFDASLHRDYVQMWHLLKSPLDLIVPAVVDHVLQLACTTGEKL